MRNTKWTALLLAAAMGFSAAGASAQSVGIRGGVNLATLSGDDIENVDSRTGINVGATLTFPMSGNLGLQVGAGLADKGASTDIEGFDAEVKLSYIEVPVLLQLMVPTQGSIAPHFGVGPAFSFKMGCDIEGSFEGATASAPCDDAGFDVSSFDIGLMGNAGLAIATSSALSITFDVLYDWGFSSIANDDAGESVDVKNRAWSFLAGVAFPLGG